MSHAHQPHSSNTTFSLHIKAVGQGKRCPPELRCPKPLDLPFPATYYDLEDSDSGRHGGKSQTPWVGTIDLEQYYYDQYQRHDTCGLASSSASPVQDPPDHPGYHVAPVGQLQMIVKTPTNAIKAFLVPYDLRALPIGGRLLAMEQTFVCAAPSHPSSEPVSPDPAGRSPSTTAWAGLGRDKGKRKESLRYAYQLQFVCLAAPKRHTAREGSTTRCPSSAVSSPSSSFQAEGTEPERAYYLSKTLKVIFTSTPPELDEQTRTERTDEIVPSSTGIRVSNPVKQRRRSSAAGTGAGTLAASPSLKRTAESWELVRLKWLARRDMLQDKDHDPDQDQPSPRYHEPDNQSAVPSFKPGVPGRAPTPVPQPFNLPNSAVATPTKPPPSPRFQRRHLRRTSAEERELSEKLRNMGLE